MIIGKKLRELREQKGMLLRQVGAHLEVDTTYISKMERGEKNIKREFVLKLAGLYQTDPELLIKTWLADRVYDIIKNEPCALDALQLVTDKISER
jgi:HTH-type transcriptional regulator, competence development regulator